MTFDLDLWPVFCTCPKKIDEAGNTEPPASDLVLFKLELTPNQWHSHLKNTSIQSIRDVPYLRRIWASPFENSQRKAILKSITKLFNMTGARNQTKGIRSIWAYSNLPIRATRPLAVQKLQQHQQRKSDSPVDWCRERVVTVAFHKNIRNGFSAFCSNSTVNLMLLCFPFR